LAAIIRKHRIEALQVVDIPLAPAAIRAGRRFQIPVVLDMWENYPEALRLWAQTDWTTLVFKNYRVARAVERYVVKRVDHIFTVVEEQKERLQAEGIPKERISVVTNAVDLELFLRTPVRNDTPLDAEPAAFKLLYVGKLTSERGLDDMIQACALVRPMVPAVRLYIAGTGNDEPRLRTIAARHGVAGHIHFLGWVSFEDIHSYILKSDLCLVPHVYSDFINTTIPNKLFQYMALAKPVLVSNARPLARIVTESGCGYTFQSGDPADAARKIVDAYQARSSREHGERGSRYVREHYTWEKVAPALLRVYEQLESQRPAAAGAGR
jgi:glycosyltransferase involved in cell wall biosynthesis